MATNDYRSYMRATEEYRHSDTLQHAGKKGMKWGISHTPGYKAIGQKAKGLLNAAGQYIYDTAKKVGNAATTTYNKVVKSFDSAAKKPTVQTYDNSTKTFENNVQTWDDVNKKLTNKTPAVGAIAGGLSAIKKATKDPSKEARDEAFKERQQKLGQKYVEEYKKKFDKTPNADLLPKPNPIPPGTPKKEEEKTESHAEVVGKIDAKEGPKEPQKDDLKEDERGKYRIVDGEKHYDLGDGKEYLYADGTFFEVGGTGKTVPEGKTPEPAKPGSMVPSDDMVDAEGNLKLLDQHGPYFDADGEKHYDLGDGKAYLYSDGLYFPVDGSGEALALVWNDEKFCFEPAEDVRHSEESPKLIRELLFPDSDQNELYHEGRGHEDGGHSGRYPWGSGKEPYQRNPPAGYVKAKEVLKEVGDQPVSYINKYGVIDVQTVYNNKNPSSIESPAKQNAKKGAVLNEAIVGLDKLTKGDAVGVAKAADNTGKAIENLGRREWTVADFEGIPTEQIQESNRRQAAIETWTKNNGTKTPVEKGKATTAKFLELLGAGIVLYETFKPKESA